MFFCRIPTAAIDAVELVVDSPLSVPVFPTEVDSQPAEQRNVKAGQELLDPHHGFGRTGFDFGMNDESHDVVLRSLEAIQSRDKIETVKEIAPPIAATEPKGVRSAGQTVEFGSGSMRLFTLNRRLNFGFGCL